MIFLGNRLTNLTIDVSVWYCYWFQGINYGKQWNTPRKLHLNLVTRMKWYPRVFVIFLYCLTSFVFFGFGFYRATECNATNGRTVLRRPFCPSVRLSVCQSIFARSASAVTPSKKNSIYTNTKSTTRFPVSLRWTAYVDRKPPKRVQKTQNGRSPSKIALHLKKFRYKVSLYCQQQSCKAFIGLSIRAKMVRGGTSSTTWKFGRNWPTPFKNADLQLMFIVALKH